MDFETRFTHYLTMDYITLTSDSSMDIFPDNTIGQFRVKLPKKISLDRRRHQIGLKYISFPHKTQNIKDGEIHVKFYSSGREGWPLTFKTHVPSGYYKGPVSLVNAINTAMKYIPKLQRRRYREIADEGFLLNEGHLTFMYHIPDERVSLNSSQNFTLKDGSP